MINLSKIQGAIMGKNAPVSLVFASPAKMRELNRTYRKKSYTPNVLSFRLGKNDGDIFICKQVASKEARALGVTVSERIAYLFIHGLLHLKGMRHGHTMDSKEKKYVQKFLLRN
jgi:probable rRNA maturation factor